VSARRTTSRLLRRQVFNQCAVVVEHLPAPDRLRPGTVRRTPCSLSCVGGVASGWVQANREHRTACTYPLVRVCGLLGAIRSRSPNKVNSKCLESLQKEVCVMNFKDVTKVMLCQILKKSQKRVTRPGGRGGGC